MIALTASLRDLVLSNARSATFRRFDEVVSGASRIRELVPSFPVPGAENAHVLEDEVGFAVALKRDGEWFAARALVRA